VEDPTLACHFFEYFLCAGRSNFSTFHTCEGLCASLQFLGLRPHYLLCCLRVQVAKSENGIPSSCQAGFCTGEHRMPQMWPPFLIGAFLRPEIFARSRHGPILHYLHRHSEKCSEINYLWDGLLNVFMQGIEMHCLFCPNLAVQAETFECKKF
jgi:hypothetical protein